MDSVARDAAQEPFNNSEFRKNRCSEKSYFICGREWNFAHIF